MRESGYYPPGAEHDPRAPWNVNDDELDEEERARQELIDEWFEQGYELEEAENMVLDIDVWDRVIENRKEF